MLCCNNRQPVHGSLLTKRTVGSKGMEMVRYINEFLISIVLTSIKVTPNCSK